MTHIRADSVQAQLQQSFPDVPLLDIRLTCNVATHIGAFSDVWEGEMRDPVVGRRRQKVAVKRLRLNETDKGDEQTILYNRVTRELSIWSHLHHSNILPLCGIRIEDDARMTPALIAPWMAYGTLQSYVLENVGFDYRHLLLGIADGLAYLHSVGIVHCDIKSDNILIDIYREPYIMDFGLSFIPGGAGEGGDEPKIDGNPRWLAPECLYPEQYGLSETRAYSKASDMYALGMTMYEMSCSRIPFEDVKDPYDVFQAVVVQEQRPDHPGEIAIRRGMDDELWSFVQRCWDADRLRRPSAADLVDLLRNSSVQPTVQSLSDRPVDLASSFPSHPHETAVAVAQVLLRASKKMVDTRFSVLSIAATCKRFERSLELGRTYETTTALRDAIAAGQQVLNGLLQEVQTAEGRWVDTTGVTKGQIQADLSRWSERILTALEEFTISLLREFISGSIELTRLATDETLELNVITLGEALRPNVASSVQDLLDKASAELRKPIASITTGDQETIIKALCSLLKSDPGPLSVSLSGNLSVVPESSMTLSASDVYRAIWTTSSSTCPSMQTVVALKRLQKPTADPGLYVRRLMRSGMIWRLLSHPNIIPFYGVVVSETTVDLVSMWAEHGDVTKYLTVFPEADRHGIVFDVAQGLAYLHRCELVHGSVRAAHMLINGEGRAMLSDCGHAFAWLEPELPFSLGNTRLRWTAPEVEMSRSTVLKPPSDIFSFGLSILEIMTGEIPFADIEDDARVAVMLRRRLLDPIRPSNATVVARGLTDDLWKLLKDMLNHLAEDRPPMSQVVSSLRGWVRNSEKSHNREIHELDKHPRLSATSARQEVSSFFQGAVSIANESSGGVDGVYMLFQQCRSACNLMDDLGVNWETVGAQRAADGLQQVLAKIQRETSEHRHACLQEPFPARDELYPQKFGSWSAMLTAGLRKYLRDMLEDVLMCEPDVKATILKKGKALLPLRRAVSSCSKDDLERVRSFIAESYEILQSVSSSSPEAELISEGLRSLLTIDTVPRSLRLEGDLVLHNSIALMSGRSDIFQGTWNRRIVAVKRMRDLNAESRRLGGLLLEAAIWRTLHHPNILPFYGIDVRSLHARTRVSLVSLWAPNRDVMTFLYTSPGADRRTLILGTAYGLSYLHRCGVVHGSVRGSNIVVGANGKPMLTDYGLWSMANSDNDQALIAGMSSEPRDIARWLAPEHMNETQPVAEAGDVFSFGRTILEIMTGERPFASIKNTWRVAALLWTGELQTVRPVNPVVVERGLTDAVWELLSRMWETDPSTRPTMAEVVRELEMQASA